MKSVAFHVKISIGSWLMSFIFVTVETGRKSVASTNPKTTHTNDNTLPKPLLSHGVFVEGIEMWWPGTLKIFCLLEYLLANEIKTKQKPKDQVTRVCISWDLSWLPGSFWPLTPHPVIHPVPCYWSCMPVRASEKPRYFSLVEFGTAVVLSPSFHSLLTAKNVLSSLTERRI